MELKVKPGIKNLMKLLRVIYSHVDLHTGLHIKMPKIIFILEIGCCWKMILPSDTITFSKFAILVIYSRKSI